MAETVMLATCNSTPSENISRRGYTANTRTAILSGLNEWSHNPNGANTFWMNGMVGASKTTIAYSFSGA